MQSAIRAHPLAAGARLFDHGAMNVVTIGDATLTWRRRDPGWRWSTHMRPIVGTESCEAAHLILLLSGQLRFRLKDGTEFDLRPGEVAAIPPGHDAWVIGEEPCEGIDYSSDFAQLAEAGEALAALTDPSSVNVVSRAEAAKRMRAEADAGRLDPHAVDVVLGAVGQASRRRLGPRGLSEREVEVLTLIATGASAKQVAVMLCIAEKTVRNHIERIYAKCDVSTRAEATRFALAHRLIEPLSMPS